MKTNLLSTLFFLLLHAYAFSSTKKSESLPEYWIENTEKISALEKNTSQFKINCKIDNGVTPLRNKTISYSVNGQNYKVDLGKEGSFFINLNPGKYKFQFYLDASHFEIYTDSISILPQNRITMSILFVNSELPVISDKPVIYFYPETQLSIKVKLDVDSFNFVYPAFNSKIDHTNNNAWEFTAYPNGEIECSNRRYNYLFWEANTVLNVATIDWNKGAMVKKENLLNYLESTLTAMGLSSKEQQDFITYWVPRMLKNETNYIHFLFNEEFETYAPLSISPKPDHQFRVYMIWINGDSIDFKTTLTPQEFPTFKREGFSVLEWGGTEVLALPF